MIDWHVSLVAFSMLDDIEGCNEAIKKGYNNTWCATNPGAQQDLDIVLNGESCINPSTWDLEDFLACPPRYSLALLRAHAIHADYNDESYPKGIAIADQFKKIMLYVGRLIRYPDRLLIRE